MCHQEIFAFQSSLSVEVGCKLFCCEVRATSDVYIHICSFICSTACIHCLDLLIGVVGRRLRQSMSLHITATEQRKAIKKLLTMLSDKQFLATCSKKCAVVAWVFTGFDFYFENIEISSK